MVDEETVVWNVLAPGIPIVTVIAVVCMVEFPFALALLARVLLVLTEIESVATDTALLPVLEEFAVEAEVCAPGVALAAATVELVETVA